MSEDLRTDHVKLESPSILTKNLFLPGHWGGALSTPVLRILNVHVLNSQSVVDVMTVVALNTCACVRIRDCALV